jgi:hypothetical protein
VGPVAHKLIRQGNGERLWGECSCGGWAWIGTYELPKGRLAKLRAAHLEHVEIVAEHAERGLDIFGRPLKIDTSQADTITSTPKVG